MADQALPLEHYLRSLVAEDRVGLRSPFVVSAVGGGGKTSTLLQLFDRQLRPRSILTATTALGLPGSDDRLAPPLTPSQRENPALSIVSASPPAGSGLWLGSCCEGQVGKHRGVDRELLDQWVRDERKAGHADTVIFCEADGSKRKPLKAHAGHEPVIPQTTDLTLILFGLSGLDQPLDEAIVHRSSLFSAVAGLEAGGSIQMDHLLALLRSGHFFKGIPLTSRVAVVFNQADCLTGYRRRDSMFRGWAEQVLAIDRVDAVFFTGREEASRKTYFSQARSNRLFPPISAVIMAAGQSKRMEGPNKLLLPLGRQSVIARTVGQVLAGGIRDLILVTGFEAGLIEAEVRQVVGDICPGARLSLAHNAAYPQGQGGSVALGARQLGPDSQACFFVPADQPFISPLLIRHLMEAFERGFILVPEKDGVPSAPVLFDRRFYPCLSTLSGNLGGRQIIRRHPDAVLAIRTEDPADSFDLDTPEDYARALALDRANETEERRFR